MRVRLTINAPETWGALAGDLRRALGDVASQQFKEIWLAMDPEPSLCALMFTSTVDDGLSRSIRILLAIPRASGRTA
jgi:hypothetical protein